MPRATVLIPTFDHGQLLLYSTRSALAQTIEDIEVFIIGDGATDETRAAALELASEDERVRFFDNPKGPSRGELHRHAALQEARGEIVCYLSDDDLWLPEHVETMLHFLEEADFAGAMQVVVREDGSLRPTSGDISLPHYQNLMLSGLRGVNRVPLSSGAHTMEMYRKLPHGWRTSPPEAATDLYMWQQFLSLPECRAVSTARPTVLQFPSPQRRDWTGEERRAELETWSWKVADPAWRQGFVYEVLDRTVRGRADHVARLEHRVRTREERLQACERELTQLREKHRRLGEHHRRYKQQIESSRSWKLAKTLARLKARTRESIGQYIRR
jgi:GalNAc5-diNAcBac-PP-undecaprenol beta-1,3-glucosyltransferase